MKFLVCITVCIGVCHAVPSLVQEWASFKAKHGKIYSSPKEEQFRLGVYLSNKQMIEEHNVKYKAGLVPFELKMNHFGDKLQNEISAEMNGFNRTGQLVIRKGGLKFQIGEDVEAPPSVDWREKGAVTPVKNQGQCGSCWAFSTTGSLEGQIFRKTGKLVSLSEQNLVDCATEDYGNNGCDGGLMDQAFEYIIGNNGIDSEESYPYEGTENECRFRKSNVAGTVSSYVDIPQEDEAALKHALATVGPISVAMNAGLRSFSFYNQGVFNDESCDPAVLNHGVLLVGYGTENGQDYWLIKNSWSPSWGEDGYVKIARNQGNLCGIASMASYPVV